MLKTIIIILLAFSERQVLGQDSSKNLVNLKNVSSGNDSSLEFGEISAINIASGEINSQEVGSNEKWVEAGFLPLSDEDFPVALYASKSKNDASQENQMKSLPLKAASSSSSSSSETEDVLKRMGWTGGEQDRFSTEIKPWSKAIPSQVSTASSPISMSPNPINNGNAHQQEITRQNLAVGHGNNQDRSNIEGQHQSMNSPIEYPVNDLSASASSNNYEVPPSSSSSTAYGYSSSTASASTTGGRTRYGFRVGSRPRDPEFSGSSNYDDFTSPDYPSSPVNEGSYSEPYENGPPPTSEDYRPDMKHSGPPASGSPGPAAHSSNEYERDPRPAKYPSYHSRPRFRPRNQYLTSTSSWPEYSEWDATSPSDRGWLSSLFGGYSKYSRPRYRSPYGLNSIETLPLSSLPMNFFETDSLNLMRPPSPVPLHPRATTGWGFGGFSPRPHSASSMRPGYGPSFPYSFGPRSPPMGPPPNPYYSSSPYYQGTASSLVPISVRPYSFSSALTGMLGSPSISYPVKVPYSPYPMFGRAPYPMFRPFMPSDLAFAESFRKMNTSDKMEAAQSQNQLSFVNPPVMSTIGGLPQALPQPGLINRQGSTDQMFNFFDPNLRNINPTKSSNDGETSTQNPHDNRSKPVNVVGKIFGRWLT